MSVVQWLIALIVAIVVFVPVVFAVTRPARRMYTVVILNFVAVLWMATFPHVLIIPVVMWFAALILAFRD